jgi:uncharacterized protein (DUF1684 family)
MPRPFSHETSAIYDAPMDERTARPWLADWRRLVAELYAEVRRRWPGEPAGARELWRTERERLYREHPQSPVPSADRDDFRARHWPYDDRFAFEVVVQPVAAPFPGPAPLALPNSRVDDLAFDRIGRVRLPLPGVEARLSLFWMRGYAGGLFLPFTDATSGGETYGAGRYVLDTAKGADLGGDPAAGTLVVDLNFAFQPSCAFDPRWACPLAPPENRLVGRIEAGERLH